MLAVGFSFRCCSTPFLWSCPKKRGGAPKKNAFGWWRPREVSGPARLSHSRGRCHSAAKVSASRTDWITRRHGEGFGLEVDWRLKVFCPAFLQKSGRGPGAAPLAARRSARNSLMLKKRRRGLKGEPSPGVPPLRAAPPPAALATPWGWRWTKERVVEDADPYGGWKTGRVPRDILRGYPTPGRGSAERSDAGGDRSSGTSGRRPLQGGCGNVRSAIIPRPGGGEPRPYRGMAKRGGVGVDRYGGRRGRRPLRGFACLTVVRKKNAASGRHFSLCVLVYITIAFLGQMSWQVPQAMHLSSSRVQVLAARSTARAPAGHFLAQSVQ